MGPLTLSALIAGTVALSSDVLVSACTYSFMNRNKDKLKESPRDPLKDIIKRKGSYANFKLN